MKKRLIAILLASTIHHGCAATIDSKEILMLIRNGIPQSEIAADVQQRGLARPLTPTELSTLKTKGAFASLLAIVSSPASAGSRSEAGSYKDRIQERKLLEKLPKVWVYGCLSEDPRVAGSIVICAGANPSMVVSPETRAEASVYFAVRPSTFTDGAAREMVNCEAAVTGNHRIKTPEGRDLIIQEVVMLHDFGPLAEAHPTASLSPTPATAGAK